MKKSVFVASLIIIFAFLIFVVSFVSAYYKLSSYSIDTNYSYGGQIRGYMIVNLSNFPYNSRLTTNLGGNFSAISLMNSSSYTCNPIDCNYTYTVLGSGAQTKNFHLDKGNSKIIGFLIQSSNPLQSIDGFTLNITSSAAEDNKSQLSIDFLDDNSSNWGAYKPSGVFSSTKINGACYDVNKVTGSPADINTEKLCENISLPASAGIKIGAGISGSGVSNLTMTLEDSGKSELGHCTILGGSPGAASCIVEKDSKNITISKGDYYICVNLANAPVPGKDKYQISYEDSPPTCGYAGSSSFDFPVYAWPGKFAPVGNFVFNDTEFNAWRSATGVSGTKTLKSYAWTYISEKYPSAPSNSIDCSKGCVVPIKFTASQSQDINLSDLEVDYNIGIPTHTSDIYNISKMPPTFSTKGYQKIYLDDAHFSAGSFGSHNFTLSISNSTGKYILFSQNISVRRVPKVISVNPTITAAVVPTPFSANVNTYGSNVNITSYRWDFGDGSNPTTTTTNTTMHTFNNTGNYKLTISVTNLEGLNSSSNFTIKVTTPKEAVNLLLGSKLADLKEIKKDLENYSTFAQNELSRTLNLSYVSAKLSKLQTDNKTASSDESYIRIMNNLTSINMPDSIVNTLNAKSIILFPSNNSIDLDALKAIGGGTYNSSRINDYKKYIIQWDLSNATAFVDYSEFSGVQGENEEPLLNTVEITISGDSSRENSYLIIPSLTDIHFDKNYSKSGDYYYVPVSTEAETVMFSTTQSISTNSLPFFISPSLSQISLPTNEVVKENNNKWIILVLAIMGIFFFGFIIYTILGKWYQKRYESYLFKNKNDLYNIVNYVHSSKSKGIKNNEIERTLRRSRWSSEQVSYVMKKYAGKGVGLPGFIKRMRNIRR